MLSYYLSYYLVRRPRGAYLWGFEFALGHQHGINFGSHSSCSIQSPGGCSLSLPHPTRARAGAGLVPFAAAAGRTEKHEIKWCLWKTKGGGGAELSFELAAVKPTLLLLLMFRKKWNYLVFPLVMFGLLWSFMYTHVQAHSKQACIAWKYFIKKV